jgi:plastocyanin
MRRRDFLRAAGGTAAAATAAGAAAAQEDGNTTTGNGTATGNATVTGNVTTTGGNETAAGGGGGGPTETVAVGPGNSLVYTPGTNEPLRIAPGTTVEFVWESNNHNIVVDSQPEGASWPGTPGAPDATYDSGYTYSYTFETLGTYEYACEPHRQSGMVGTIEVVENPQAAEAQGTKALHDLGVPIQAHWVGSATILGILVTVVYSFYILKYGESPNTGNTGGRD